MDNIMNYQITTKGINFTFAKVGNGRPFPTNTEVSSEDFYVDWDYVENEFKNLEFTGKLQQEIEEANLEEDSLEIELSFR